MNERGAAGHKHRGEVAAAASTSADPNRSPTNRSSGRSQQVLFSLSLVLDDPKRGVGRVHWLLFSAACCGRSSSCRFSTTKVPSDRAILKPLPRLGKGFIPQQQRAANLAGNSLGADPQTTPKRPYERSELMILKWSQM